jgi:hypothetical protein
MVENVTESIQATVSNILQNTVTSLPECGEGRWFHVVNFVAASDGCPSPWVLQNIDGASACGRASSSVGSCDSVFFPAGGLSYSKVCGQIAGRAILSPDGLEGVSMTSEIDQPYVDGVSITHSMPRAHIWTLAADVGLPTACPCSTITGLPNLEFVGENFFCDFTPEGEARTPWDGEGCIEDTSQTCCDFNTPPYFSTTLASPTTDDIEVRICADEGSLNEDVFIEFMELFVQ